MGLDRDAVFVMETITREGIAQAFNDWVYGGRAVVAGDDERLTDERCARTAVKFAEALRTVEGYGDDVAVALGKLAKEFWFEDPYGDEQVIAEASVGELTEKAEALVDFRSWSGGFDPHECDEEEVGEFCEDQTDRRVAGFIEWWRVNGG
jgi:hypothetical protein